MPSEYDVTPGLRRAGRRGLLDGVAVLTAVQMVREQIEATGSAPTDSVVGVALDLSEYVRDVEGMSADEARLLRATSCATGVAGIALDFIATLEGLLPEHAATIRAAWQEHLTVQGASVRRLLDES